MLVMLKQSKRNLYRHELEKTLDSRGIKTPTGAQVFDMLFGTYGNDYHTDFIVKERWVNTKQTVLHRINSLWVYPLFVLLMPFRYVMFGNPKVDEDSTLGKILIF